MIIKSKSKPLLPPVPGGTYLAVCVYAIDIGEQLCKYKDTERYNNQVVLGFELAGKTIEIDGKQEPRVLSRTFNVSLGQNSGLRKFVSSWAGKKLSDDEFGGMDTNALVGKPAFVSVVLSEDGQYSNIDTALPLPDGIPAPQAASPLIRFDLEPFDQTAFDALPGWAQERIKKSTDWAKKHASTETIQATDAISSGPAGPLLLEGKALTADPATGEVVEAGGTDSSASLRFAQNDRTGGAPF